MPRVSLIVMITLIVLALVGVVEIACAQTGRSIDLYGGSGIDAANSNPYVVPYGGQGPGQSMDMVPSNSTLILCANVTLDDSPIQGDEVRFVLQDTHGNVMFNNTALTDQYGMANITFAMPLPSDDPSSVFGIWSAKASAIVSGYQIDDSTSFVYNWKVNLWRVTTNKASYNSTEIVSVMVDLGTYSMSSFQVLVKVDLVDASNVTLGGSSTNPTIGGAFPMGNAKNYTFFFNIFIPVFAANGTGHVYVAVFDRDPGSGGSPLCPAYSPPPEIQINGRLSGDLNGDNIVDIYDAIILAGAFNSHLGSPNWNPNADINSDGTVDIYDAIILAGHYGQHYP